MNKEIKELIDKLKDNKWYDELDLTGDKWIELKQTETKQLLDYITNLQQENEELKKNQRYYKNGVSKLNDEVHIVIGRHGYGKTYHEENKKLLKLREQYVREIQDFDFLNGNNKSEELRYYMNKGAIEVLDYLLRIRGIFK